MIQNVLLTQVLDQVASRFNEPEEALVSAPQPVARGAQARSTLASRGPTKDSDK